MMTKKDIILATTASIAASADSLSKLSDENWTEERHIEAVAMLAKIAANKEALQAMYDKYEPIIAKFAQTKGIDIEGISRQKIPDVEGNIREVDMHMHVGPTTTTSTSPDKAAIHAATGYKVENDPTDPCVKKIRVNDPAAWDLYKTPTAAIEPTACMQAVSKGKLDPSCSKTTIKIKFGVEYKINDADRS